MIGRIFGHGVRNGVVLGKQCGNFSHPIHHCLEHRAIRIEWRLLRHIAPADSRLLPHGPVVKRSLPGQRTQQRRFAGAVSPDQRHAFTRIKLEISMIKKGNMAIGQRSIGQNQLRHEISLLSRGG